MKIINIIEKFIIVKEKWYKEKNDKKNIEKLDEDIEFTKFIF